MRRLVTALAALALLLLTAAGMKNADALAANCRSVSLRWRQPVAAETAEAARAAASSRIRSLMASCKSVGLTLFRAYMYEISVGETP